MRREYEEVELTPAPAVDPLPFFPFSSIHFFSSFLLTLVDRGIDVYSAQGELINHFSEPDLITAVPAVVQFHPRKDWIVGGTASGKVVAYGLPESSE